MKFTALCVSAICAAASVNAQAAGATCNPSLTTTALGLGKAVPMKPEDIPKGCSDFEVLVGSCLPGAIFQNKTTMVLTKHSPRYQRVQRKQDAG
jgi:hypothetical protein